MAGCSVAHTHNALELGLPQEQLKKEVSMKRFFGKTLALFGVLPIGSQWYHWLTNGTNFTIGRANGAIGITIGTNGITNGTIGKTLNDIGMPLVPLGNPEHTHCIKQNRLDWIALE